MPKCPDFCKSPLGSLNENYTTAFATLHEYDCGRRKTYNFTEVEYCAEKLTNTLEINQINKVLVQELH